MREAHDEGEKEAEKITSNCGFTKMLFQVRA